MKTVQEHYARHLAPIYSWMVGGEAAAMALAESELDALHLPAAKGDAVLDLGAGFGMYAVPLARRGALVTAVDTSDALLGTLSSLAEGLPVRTVNEDLVGFLKAARESYAAVLCMGDTIAHLANVEEVSGLMRESLRVLLPDGLLVLTFRDYTNALVGEQRFIPVRADDERIHTCFLEYEGQSVVVHDIVQERKQAGWQTQVSAYSKLRLAPGELMRMLEAVGFVARKEAGLRGMVRLVARKP